MDTVMAAKKIKDRGVAAPSISKAGITRRCRCIQSFLC